MKLKDDDVTDVFYRLVFGSLVDKVIVGEITENGTTDTHKLAFMLKDIKISCVKRIKQQAET